MVGQDYLKLQNQGNIISNIRLLHEMDMAKDYADSQGYYTKKSVAEIGVNALIITSGNSVGEEAHRIINAEGDESRNSPLQNAKARMQILRVLGLVSADYGSEVYAITRLGKLAISQVLNNNPNYGILRELFVNITTATEIYEHNCAIDFNCYLGFGICYALSQLEYRLSSDEMPLLTTYDIKDIDQFVEEARLNRQEGKTFTETHPHYPKTQKNQPVKQVSNLTRSVNQILRVCGIIEPKQRRIGDVNYYVCTEAGRKYVDTIKQRYKTTQFWTAYKFRKINNIAEQKEMCVAAYNAILFRSGIDDSLSDCNKMFSPYQMLPETNVEWLMGSNIEDIRKHPDKEYDRLKVINSQITIRDLRLKAIYREAQNQLATETHMMKSVREDISNMAVSNIDMRDIASHLCTKYQYADKSDFYPFVHALLNIIGLECKGEISRYDAYCVYKGHVIPVEIKSYTETHAYNAKGVRQAIENKILSYDESKTDDINYASLLIGYEHPDNDTEIRCLIDQAYDKFRIRVIACDLLSLSQMATRRVLEQKVLDFEQILTKHGILTD